MPSGRSLTLNCTVGSASQPIRIRWYKGDNDVDVSRSNFVMLSNGALRINSVQRPEEGSYHCTAEDSRGKMIVSRDAVISVACKYAREVEQTRHVVRGCEGWDVPPQICQKVTFSQKIGPQWGF